MNTQDVTKAAADAAPPVLYVALRFGGMSLPDWVAVFTLAYIILQGAFLIWRWRQQANKGGGD